MPATWKQADVFPIIAGIVDDAYARARRFITHDEIAAALLRDPQAAGIIDEAQKDQEERQSSEWFAHNMVAWFSQKITEGQSDWENAFERTRIDGKWAYKPMQKTAPERGQE